MREENIIEIRAGLTVGDSVVKSAQSEEETDSVVKTISFCCDCGPF